MILLCLKSSKKSIRHDYNQWRILGRGWFCSYWFSYLESHFYNRMSCVSLKRKNISISICVCVTMKLNGRVSLDQGNFANRLDRVAHDFFNFFFRSYPFYLYTRGVHKLKTKWQWDRTDMFLKKNIELLYILVF